MTNPEGMTMLDGARWRLEQLRIVIDAGLMLSQVEDSENLAADLSALLTSEAAYKVRVEELTEALGWFLNDERFQVGVGGNPNVVERMIASARQVLKGQTDERAHA